MAAIQLADTSKITGKPAELLSQFEKGMGFVPNVVKQMANSPATLESFLTSRDLLSKGSLDAQMIAMIGILIAETYSCEYLLAARIAMAKKIGMTEEEITLAKQQSSKDPKKDVGLSFVRNVVVRHGDLPAGDLAEVKAAGYSDAEVVELLAQVSLNLFVYYMIQIGQPELDFEKVKLAFPA